jgi:hypothetical protein
MFDYFEPEVIIEIACAKSKISVFLTTRDQNIRRLVLSVLLYILSTRNISLSRV